LRFIIEAKNERGLGWSSGKAGVVFGAVGPYPEVPGRCRPSTNSFGTTFFQAVRDGRYVDWKSTLMQALG